MDNCRAADGCRVLGRDAPQLSSRRRSCPTRHDQRYARADVHAAGDHLVLWGGLLEAGTAVIVARRSPKPKKAKFVHVRAKVPSIPRHPGPQTGVPCLASNKAQPRRKPFEIYASRLPGFTLRVQPSGVRWYYARFRRNRRVVLGKVGTVAPEDARDRC
ncbi:MAG: DUF4102 domain-containing protein [Gammaproteobacteria bacterium]|nr:MAG: DUF4102 domain-containing protein [Gammaproteobacteria bacterium]